MKKNMSPAKEQSGPHHICTGLAAEQIRVVHKKNDAHSVKPGAGPLGLFAQDAT